MSPVTSSSPSVLPMAVTNILSAYLSEKNQELLIGIIISFVVWNVINLVVMNLSIPDKHLKWEDRIDLRNRIVSIIHGSTSMIMSGYNTYFVHSQCGEHNTSFEEFLLIFSNGYFAYDLVAMAYLGILDKSMFIHHNICVIGLSSGLFTGFGADILIGALFLTEISNPAMHIRVIMRLLDKRYTKCYEYAELTYMRKSLNL